MIRDVVKKGISDTPLTDQEIAELFGYDATTSGCSECGFAIEEYWTATDKYGKKWGEIKAAKKSSRYQPITAAQMDEHDED